MNNNSALVSIIFPIYNSKCNDKTNRQESLIRTCANETIGGAGEVTFASGKAPDIAVFINYDNDHATASNNWRKRVTGCKVYMREIKSPSSSDRSEWYPQCTCDFIKGEITAYESQHTETATYNVSGTQHIFYLANQYLIRPHKRSTYEIEVGVPEDEEVTMMRYKTSVLANRRLYVGNLYVTYPDGDTVRMGDTMIKSVVNKFDLLPLSSKIDVAIRDGDDIVRLEEYADRILQFKRKTLYINLTFCNTLFSFHLVVTVWYLLLGSMIQIQFHNYQRCREQDS